VRILKSADQMRDFHEGEVLVADMTDPDWEPIMKRASAIVTNRGGRTCHAAIIARELGIPAVVGTGSATRDLAEGREVTVSCARATPGSSTRACSTSRSRRPTSARCRTSTSGS
jgi:pyruvate,water dikinase